MGANLTLSVLKGETHPTPLAPNASAPRPESDTDRLIDEPARKYDMSDLNTTPTSAAAPGRRSILTAGALGIGALTLGASTAQATGRPASSVPTTTAGFSPTGRGWGAKGKIPPGLVRTRLIPWARDTWRSLDQMTVRATGSRRDLWRVLHRGPRP